MSSFICSANHFNSIEMMIPKIISLSEFNSYNLKEFGLYKYNTSLNESVVKVAKYIQDLRELNVVCFYLQYKDGYDESIDVLIPNELQYLKNPTKVKELTPLGLYNALICLNYQIETEHLKELRGLTEEEQMALDFLEVFTNSLARFICQIAPEDKTNKWSID